VFYQRTEPELERSVTEQLAKESGPASDALALRWRLRHWRPKGSIGLRPNAPHRKLLRKSNACSSRLSFFLLDRIYDNSGLAAVI
jgi:hypothetical protein